MKMRWQLFCNIVTYGIRNINHGLLRKIVKVALILTFIVLNPSSLYSQNSKFVFSHINVNNGISDNFIKCIYRDQKGFIWFGTNSGLNRFDGYKFEIFQQNNSDTASITNNAINAITSDLNGNLWVGTGGGVSELDSKTFKFRRINLRPSPSYSCQDIGYITAMTTGSGGNIMIGTHNGLFLSDRTNSSFTHILIDKKNCSSLSNSITSVCQDKSGSFWIGTINGSIFRYNMNSDSIEKIDSYNESRSLRGSIYKLYVDNDANLWMADPNGLHIFNTNKFSWDSDLFDGIFANHQISGIAEDNQKMVWIITDGNGAFVFDNRDSSIVNITNMPYDEGSLSSNGLSSLFCDEAGIIWIGNSKKGVDFYKKNVRKFRLYRNYPTEPNSLSSNDVNCIAEDSKGNLWIGTNGNGLDYYDRTTNHYDHYVTGRGTAGLSSNVIVSVYEDSEKKVWIGTYLGGLNRLDPGTGKFEVFHHSDSDSTTISDDRVWSICEDSHKNLWVATLTSGLNLYNRKTGKFRRINSSNSPICFDYIISIKADEKDNLWISSAHGLIYYDPKQNTSKCYYNDPDDPASLSDNQVISTFKDSRGLFWVCTNNGLNLMDRKKNNFRVFKVADGLPSDRIFKIEEDKDSNLWLSTKKGLSKLLIRQSSGKDSLSFQFVNYAISDGLQGNEFNETASVETKDGELWFGGPDGLNAFYPLEIKEDSTSSKVVISGIRIDNEAVRYGDVINGRVLFDKPIFNTDKIVLKFIENSFTIDFVALNYFFPGKNRYSYTLEGFNDKWITTEGAENYATFSNLKSGTYIFKVKGTNSDGIWNKEVATLKIRILPPLWASWYAYVLYFILISSLLLFLRYLILTRERMRAELENEHIDSQHIHEIDSMKIKFFTNISHEFRTPLSLIVSPAEKLMAQMKNKPEEKHVNLILQNARRLLFMVNQLLDIRKMEVQGFGFNPSAGNIVAFIEEAVSSFEDLAEQKHVKLIFHSDIKELDTLFDKDKLEKILFNLLSNAFKFTPVNGEVSVQVLAGMPDSNIENKVNNQKPSQLTIKVRDTGIGIPREKIGNLFVNFYQIESIVSSDHGTGIGLALVKEFVKLHDGEITVDSEPGKGSCFSVILPVACNRKTLSENSLQKNDSKEYLPAVSHMANEDNSLRERSSILIAEDNDDLRFYIKDNLQTVYNVYEASNGKEALAIIMNIIPDLIVSDIKMPGIDGLEICKRVKADPATSHIPVILLTGLSKEKYHFESLETGADDFIPKPFSLQILEAKICNLIASRKSLKQAYSSQLVIGPKNVAITSLDENFINKALDLVEKNISKTDYTVEELSRDLCISRTLLYKKILALTGKPPLEFIRTIRLKRAAQLLQKSQLNVSEVAFQVGFNDAKYFRKHFKNEFGVLPSKYFEQFRSKQQ